MVSAPLPREVAIAPERGLAHLGVVELGGGADEPRVFDAVRGGRAHDRADVERRLHVVENEREPAVGAMTPLAVQPLQSGAVERLHRRTSRTRYARRDTSLATVHPSSPSHRASESAPRCFWTTRYATPSGVEATEPAFEQRVQRRLADADGRVAVDDVELRRRRPRRRGRRRAPVRPPARGPRCRRTARGRVRCCRRPRSCSGGPGSPPRRRWRRIRSRDRALYVAPGEGEGASSSNNLVPGSTPSTAKTPRSVVSRSETPGRIKSTSRGSERAAGSASK